MPTRILLSNFPRVSQGVKLQGVDKGDLVDVVLGYDINPDPKEVENAIVSDLINAIITYDEVCVEAIHIGEIIQCIGADDLKLLLRNGILKVIPDLDLNPAMIRKDGVFKPGFISYSISGDDNPPPKTEKWDHLSLALHRSKVNASDIDPILYLVDEHSLDIDEQRVSSVVIDEVKRDIASAFFSKAYNIIKPLSSGVYICMPRIIRFIELNKSCVLGGMLGVNGIHTDKEVSRMLKTKAFSTITSGLSDGIDVLQTIEIQKGMPSLGELYHDKYLSMETILEIRNSVQGKLFRYWAEKNEYDSSIMQRDIMNSVSGFMSTDLAKGLRFLSCSVAGLVGLVPGVAASAFDSFILDKISKGWHPNLFLDGKLGKLLDDCEKKQEDDNRQAELEKRFKGVGRNDLCPCGSGKKFKKCHGKDL